MDYKTLGGKLIKGACAGTCIALAGASFYLGTVCISDSDRYRFYSKHVAERERLGSYGICLPKVIDELSKKELDAVSENERNFEFQYWKRRGLEESKSGLASIAFSGFSLFASFLCACLPSGPKDEE